MTAQVALTREPASTPGPASAPAGELWQRWRLPLAVVVALVAVAVAAVLLRGDGNNLYLDPDGTGPDAAGAVAAVLAGNGDYRRVPTLTDAGAVAGDGATVFVPRLELVSPAGLEALLGRPELTVVLVLPDPEAIARDGIVSRAVDGLTLRAGDTGDARRPGCDLPLVAGLARADVGGTTFTADRPSTGCFAAGGRPSLLSVDATDDAARVVLLGAGDLFTNDLVRDGGNAALALRLLGGTGSVVWVQPTASQLAAGSGAGQGVVDLVPDAVRLMFLQLVLAVLVLALWRARRLGPVVSEALPVVVRGAEVVEGRGRLYARHRARGRAAALLRAGALDPVRPRLGLPTDASPQAVVAMVSARAGRSQDEVGALLFGPAPADDDALVRLAGDLDALAQALRRDGRPG